MIFQKSVIWEVVQGAETFDSFKNNFIFDFEFNEKIPEDLKKQLLVIQKLLEYSFYEYEFIDIAFIQGIVLLEKSLKIRYEEIEKKVWKKNFEKLIIWFKEKNHIKDRDNMIIDFLRIYRNKSVHQPEYMIGGLLFIKNTRHIVDLINDIFNEK